MKPKKSETGAGAAPYMFRTNKWGDGNYSSPLNEALFGKWSAVMVILHPNGDPKDMKNMVGALSAALWPEKRFNSIAWMISIGGETVHCHRNA
jgi:hypothetical protein